MGPVPSAPSCGPVDATFRTALGEHFIQYLSSVPDNNDAIVRIFRSLRSLVRWVNGGSSCAMQEETALMIFLCNEHPQAFARIYGDCQSFNPAPTAIPGVASTGSLGLFESIGRCLWDVVRLIAGTCHEQPPLLLEPMTALIMAIQRYDSSQSTNLTLPLMGYVLRRSVPVAMMGNKRQRVN